MSQPSKPSGNKVQLRPFTTVDSFGLVGCCAVGAPLIIDDWRDQRLLDHRTFDINVEHKISIQGFWCNGCVSRSMDDAPSLANPEMAGVVHNGLDLQLWS
ncbi:hypothetical protein LTR86_007371 [Recurvomyces mirabilis]|nr:hypothetical protein LTR86_007371 [Recurvomyces mirabilis]